MSKVRVAGFGMSIDGFGAGPRQSIDDPLGVGGPALMEWAFTTRTFQRMHGGGGGDTGVDEDFAARSFANVGAWMPWVTKWNVVPPCITTGSRAWCVSTKTGT